MHGSGSMRVHVRTPACKRYTFAVEPTDSVEELKALIRDVEGADEDRQRLSFQGELMGDLMTLRTCGVTSGSTVHLTLKAQGCKHTAGCGERHDGMRLFVKHLNGKTITLKVNPTNNINDVKEMILDKEGHPADRQRIVYAGAELKDARTLADCRVFCCSTMHLVVQSQPRRTFAAALER